MPLPNNVPVVFRGITFHLKLVTAVNDEATTNLHLYCNEGHAPTRIEMPALCPYEVLNPETEQVEKCGKRGTRFSFPKGRENPDGTVTILDQAELKEAVGDPVKEMLVTAHPLKDVLENTFPGKTYLTVPPGVADVEGYSLVRQALQDDPSIALVTTFAVSTATKMWRIGVNGDALAITELAWPENVRARPAIPRVEATAEDRATLREYLKQSVEPFDVNKYGNEAKARREALIASKAGTAVPLQALPTTVPANVSMSLMERLHAEVEQAKVTKAPAKKAAAKKTAARKSA